MLKQGIRYIVTKGTKDKTLIKGDRVYISENGDLVNYNAGGWVDKQEVEKVIKGALFEVDIKHYYTRKKELSKSIERINAILDEYEKGEE